MNKILADNFKCIEGSFVFYLHEMAEFNELAFWDYYNSIVALTTLAKENSHLDRKLLDMVCNTYDYILRSFMWHFHPKDLYSISNLPEDNLPLYIERLEFAFNGFIRGQIYDDNIFELPNPTINDKL